MYRIGREGMLMLVYITSGQKTALSTADMDGLPLHHLSVGRGWLARQRAVRWLRDLYASGVRRCICADEALLPLAEQVDITPYPVLPLRLALLDGLLDVLCPGGLQNATVLLRCGRGGEAAARAAAPVLARRARYLSLEDPPHLLAQELLYRWGISSGDGGRPTALTVLCGDCPPPSAAPVLYLTGDCAARQRLLWTSPHMPAPQPPEAEQLAAALLDAGKWLPSDIHITSLLDIHTKSHYNAT